MSIGHRHAPGHKILAARERELRELLDEPRFAAAVRAYDREDDTHEVPYGGGSGTDWRTIYWDHRIADAIEAGRFRIAGKPVDPRPTGKAHEAVEGAILHLWEPVRQLLGWPETTERYQRAHDLADLAERHAVAHHGWDWQEYQRQWQQLIEPIEKAPVTNPPRNLLLDPYRGDRRLFATLSRAVAGSATTGAIGGKTQPRAGQNGPNMPMNYPEAPEPVAGGEPAENGKLSHAEVHYSMAKPGSRERCDTCEHFGGRNQCEIVVAPIYPAGWCRLYEAKNEQNQSDNEENNEEVEKPASNVLLHGRAIAGASALHAAGHISADERDKHQAAARAKISASKMRKPFGSFSP